MAQLLKQQKSQSVVGTGGAIVGNSNQNLEKSNRTRTKSNATTSSMHGINPAGKEAKMISGKHSIQKPSGGSQFIGNGQP